MPSDQRPPAITHKVRGGRDVYAATRDQTVINLFVGPPPGAAVPGLLPRDVPEFTGRRKELACLSSLPEGGSAVVTAIGGTAGVGKTALAVHAAYRLLARFPDGQLYADLRGYTAGQAPAEPGEVLDVFLRRLGVDAAGLPAGEEERSGMLRDALASRRVLMVLDNVATEAQVRPLLPGAGGSLVLITSRGSLAGLEVTQRIDLDVLPTDQAEVLLVTLIGQQRAMAEPAALRRVRDRCGCLPLALRIAGQILAVHPAWTVARLAEMLADERSRLDELTAGDRQVRSAFVASYRQLPEGDGRLFRLLGLHPGPDFDAPAAASLAGIETTDAERVLDRLALAHLITENGSGRFAMHDLLRLFARETCEETDGQANARAGLRRLVGHFDEVARFLDACLDPSLRLPDTTGQVGASLRSPRRALAIFETEHSNFMSVLGLAASNGWHEEVRRLAANLGNGLLLLRQLDDLLEMATTALSAARETGDTQAVTVALRWLGTAYSGQRRFGDAITCFHDMLAICQQVGDRDAEGHALNNLGSAHQEMGRFEDAVGWYQKALAVCTETGDRRGEGRTLSNLGLAYSELQRLEEAITCHHIALSIRRDARDRLGEGRTLSNLGLAYSGLLTFEKAVTCHQEALVILREAGNPHGEGHVLANLGLAYMGMHRPEEAIASYLEALQNFRETGDQHEEGQVLVGVGDVYSRLQRREQAAACWHDAARVMEAAGEREQAALVEQRALSLLGDSSRNGRSR
jgi:tetratricopeptide (TPR) repeat protein